MCFPGKEEKYKVLWFKHNNSMPDVNLIFVISAGDLLRIEQATYTSDLQDVHKWWQDCVRGASSNDSFVILLQGFFWAPSKHEGLSHTHRLAKLFMCKLVQTTCPSLSVHFAKWRFAVKVLSHHLCDTHVHRSFSLYLFICFLSLASIFIFFNSDLDF